jgi:malonyl-CoA O-methyltransferase
MPAIDRSRVRSAFHTHAAEYDTHAAVQRRVVMRTVSNLSQESLTPRSILDIGCGTGRLLKVLAACYPEAEIAGIDMAPAMVSTARSALSPLDSAEILIADAEQLPFPAGRFDLVLSTSTYQWLESLDRAFGEVMRVLAPGGAFRFALFGSKTLHELKESYREALRRHCREGEDRTHRFTDAAEVSSALARAGFRDCRVVTEQETEHHPDVPALLRSLRRIGAGNAAASGRPRSLAERRTMQTMMTVYRETFGGNGTIPATYEVVYGWGNKRQK